MREYLLLYGIMIMVLLSGLSGCIGPEVTDYFTGEYSINPSTTLSVTNLNGQVDIIGWEGENVTVSAVKTSSYGEEGLQNVNISVSQTENHIEIITRYTSQKIIQARVDYTIKVPYNVTLDTITSSNGAIYISNTSGDILALTSNGAIRINDVNGVISATTSNGHIEIQRTLGIGDVHTSNAAITAEVRSFQEDISIDTSNAAITVYLNHLLNATMEMTTSNADIKLQGITLNESLSENTHVIGILGVDGHRIDIHTSNAPIYVYPLQP